ncbi:exocyst complex component SEC5A-like isoform X2 [Hibiscus syriacus]|uniref:exocyst complex component SEC5A-like isoform X2 n=1 Tax=Hibiscus syriacus TaxID=106335 RepID=UPI001923A5AB|nr:exocyst complex component SEC5A-like isoform X2 [Hibiscus syriacus]
MSSDNDDEDELLQRALKEQSQRDLNYQKPSSSNSRKPVANFVQPPKPVGYKDQKGLASSGPKKPTGTKGTKMSMDEDEDSEVEMLSISSGDEDEGKDPKGGSRGRPGGRSMKDDDGIWDGEEPDTWKRVDEAELARRVREMRESRTAPVAQKFERKATAPVGRVLNTLQSFPRGVECVDPLGLGIVDNKTLRLINDHSSESTRVEKDHIDSNLREKLMYYSENFDAKLFLSRIHQDTPAADLEAGALALKTDLQGRTLQRKQLVKDNFDCFVSCKTTIDDIESKLKRIEEDPEGSGTAHLYKCMQGVCSQAERAFEPLFERQAQAEKIRSVQGMLQRFRTLFNLPSTIRGSISKGEYDLAVREYKKAKSIALPSHVKILKRVLEEVERVMQEFKGMLYKSMEDPKIDLTSLENTVRWLLELEPESDPVWHYLNVQSSQVSDSLGSKSEEKLGDVRYSGHSLDEVAGMLRVTISAYEVKVLNAFRDLEESNLQSYMSDSIKEISKACLAFEAKEAAPPIVVMALRTLQAEVTKIYILKLCSWMRATTEEITKEETWVPVSVLERNKSPYTISYLPLAFRSVMTLAVDQINMMIQSLRIEATKFEDMFAQLQEIQESVKIAFLNCFLDFAGHLEHIGIELAQNKSKKESLHLQNGFSHESEEELSSDLPGSIVDPHQRLLIVLSNIGYCKDELSSELYNKYKCIWLQPRDKDEGKTDMKELVVSFLGLEEKVLEQYTFAKANLIRTAATNYLLDSGVQWGSAPAVKGVRDAAVELLHTLVAVHAEVFAGAKPLLDKTLGILVEDLIDTLISLFHENESKELSSLDTNGFCQLMLELEYFETILNPFFTSDARESMKVLQGMLLEKAAETLSEVENPGHNRRPTRGSEDAVPDERQQGASVSPDDLIALAQQYSSELLQAELERTRINTACFMESLPMEPAPELVKTAYASFRGPTEPPNKSYRGSQTTGSPSFTQRRRR